MMCTFEKETDMHTERYMLLNMLLLPQKRIHRKLCEKECDILYLIASLD